MPKNVASKEPDNELEPIEIPGEDVGGEDRVQDTNAQITALRAFANAQRSIGRVAKTGKNPHFNSKFVELHALIDAATEALSANNLFVIQTPQIGDDGSFILETLIMHENGALAARCAWPIKAKDMNDPQKVGGGMTYARRYSLMSLMNVAGEDDDGNRASTPAERDPKEILRELLVKKSVAPEDFSSRLTSQYKKSKLAELTPAEVKKEIKFYESEEGAPF